jgi:hypothetical protein
VEGVHRDGYTGERDRDDEQHPQAKAPGSGGWNDQFSIRTLDEEKGNAGSTSLPSGNHELPARP